jgi:hypothetical protein
MIIPILWIQARGTSICSRPLKRVSTKIMQAENNLRLQYVSLSLLKGQTPTGSQKKLHKSDKIWVCMYTLYWSSQWPLGYLFRSWKQNSTLATVSTAFKKRPAEREREQSPQRQNTHQRYCLFFPSALALSPCVWYQECDRRTKASRAMFANLCSSFSNNSLCMWAGRGAKSSPLINFAAADLAVVYLWTMMFARRRRPALIIFRYSEAAPALARESEGEMREHQAPREGPNSWQM